MMILTSAICCDVVGSNVEISERAVVSTEHNRRAVFERRQQFGRKIEK
jgi:hypothetical protein